MGEVVAGIRLASRSFGNTHIRISQTQFFSSVANLSHSGIGEVVKDQ